MAGPLVATMQRCRAVRKRRSGPAIFSSTCSASSDRHHLRRLLAEDHVQEGDDREGEARSTTAIATACEKKFAEQRLQQLGQGRLAEEADARARRG